MSAPVPPTVPVRAEPAPARGSASASSPLDAFQRDAGASLVAEFRRLAILSGWKRKTKTYKEERREYFARWVTEDFEAEFGVTANRLEAWQRLCRHLGVGEGRVLGSISECNEALTGTYVNIVDLVDSLKTKTRPKTFGSAQELAKYIQRTGKVFPLSKARTSPLLSKFLIHVGLALGRKRRKNKAKAQASAP